MKQINELNLDIHYSHADIVDKICHKYKCQPSDIGDIIITKEAIDARKDVHYVLNVAVEFVKANRYTSALKDVVIDRSGFESGTLVTTHRPVIVGFGPSGIFCALQLARLGLRPIVVEQGKCVEERERDVATFWETGVLDSHSNVHYGEGGAGTFSDGKLNSNISNLYTKKIINELIAHGAPQEIFYKAKPHIGTDRLKGVVRAIRQEIESLGGEVRFGTKLIDFTRADIFAVTLEDVRTGERTQVATDRLILAIGHSPYDTFKMLHQRGVTMTQKPFAMGVRIEHPQVNIDRAQYGGVEGLPSADYKLVEHLDNGRSVFTFCMCPGGYVVASSSEAGTIVTNGMSDFARDTPRANSALLVNVLPRDYDKGCVLDGFEYQRHYERLAYALGGSDYTAPAMSVSEFLGGAPTEIECSYRPRVKNADITACLPDYISESLRLALPRFDKRLKGFTEDAILIAIESRSSSPVTVNRGDDFVSVSTRGLYPIGEGAGYAGGIITSAMDGYKCALQIKKEIENGQ